MSEILQLIVDEGLSVIVVGGLGGLLLGMLFVIWLDRFLGRW